MGVPKTSLASYSEESRELTAPDFDKYSNWIHAIVGSLHIPRDMREDAVQSACLAFIEAMRRFDPNRGVSAQTYAYPFIKSAALKASYGQAKRLDPDDDQSALYVVYLSAFAADLADLPFVGEPTDTTCDPLDVVVASETAVAEAHLAATVRNWIASLPPAKRDLLVRIFYHGERQADVARARGVSKAAINQALNRLFEEGRCALGPAVQPRTAA